MATIRILAWATSEALDLLPFLVGSLGRPPVEGETVIRPSNAAVAVVLDLCTTRRLETDR